MNLRLALYSIFSFALFTAPLVVLGQDPTTYQPLVGVPGLSGNSTPANIEGYINVLYILSIGLASALAVVRIIMAGVQYMLSDVVTSKEDAKKSIRGALLGLILILAAVTVLNTINPNLTNFQIFDEDDKLTITVTEPEPRTQAAQCPPGQQFIINTEIPNGICRTIVGTPGEEDYSDSPDEGNVVCQGAGVYDPSIGACVDAKPINKPPQNVIEEREMEADGDSNYFNALMREWCQSTYPQTPQYDSENQSCVQDGAI